MPTIKTRIHQQQQTPSVYYRDWGSGPLIVFPHGWH